MKYLYFLAFSLFFFVDNCLSAPQCYENAENPAHTFPFLDNKLNYTVTGLSVNGRSCEQIQFLNGKPILERRIFAPFRTVYEAYAKAIQSGNMNALKQMYTYLRPTPRSFAKWIELLSVNEGASMELGGTEMLKKIILAVEPNRFVRRYAFVDYKDSGDNAQLNMKNVWPFLYLLLGGQIYNDNQWGEIARGTSDEVMNLFIWKYPQYYLEYDNNWRNARVHRVRLK